MVVLQRLPGPNRPSPHDTPRWPLPRPASARGPVLNARARPENLCAGRIGWVGLRSRRRLGACWSRTRHHSQPLVTSTHVNVSARPTRPTTIQINTFSQRSENSSHVNRFLAYRCDAQFLQQYLAAEPGYLKSLDLWSYLDAVSEIGVVCRLHSFSLLPEEDRKRHISTIRDLAVDTPDSGFLDKEVRALFSPDEFEECLTHVRSNLLLKLDDCISNWRFNCGSEDDPEEYFSTLEATLKDFRKEFAADESVQAAIDTGLEEIQTTIDDLRSDRPPPRRGSNPIGSLQDTWEGSRSIFDDVDE